LLVHMLVRDAYRGGQIVLYDGGHRLRPLIHIEDIVECYRRVLAAEPVSVQAQAFNASGGNFRVRDVAEMIQRRVPCRFIEQSSSDPRSYCGNRDRALRVLGYRADRTVESALDGFLGAVMNGKDREPSRYRLQATKQLIEA